MRDAVAYLRNRAKDERLAGNADLDIEFCQCADEIERLRAAVGIARSALLAIVRRSEEICADISRLAH